MEAQILNLILNAVLVSLVVYFMYYKTNQMQEGLEGLQRDLSGIKLLAEALQSGKLQLEHKENGRLCYCVSTGDKTVMKDVIKETKTEQPTLSNSFPTITQDQPKTIDEAVSGKELVSIMEEVRSKGFRVEPFIGDVDMYFTYEKKENHEQ